MNKQLITINESIQTYLNWKKSTKTKAHISYAVRLKPFGAFVDVTHLHELSGDHIFNFHDSMRKGGYSDATISYSGRILKNYIEFWSGRNQTDISAKEIIPLRYLSKEPAVVEHDDFYLMSDILHEDFKDDLQKKLAIHLLWDTGIRVSELVDLKLENINEPAEDGTRSAIIRTKKTDRYNLIAWGRITDELLTKYLGWRMCQQNESDCLFIQIGKSSSKCITTRTVERWVKQISKDALIGKSITPHSFRHGKAHNILNNGGTAIDVQAVLRHKNLNSSLNYMRLNKSEFIKRAGTYLDKNVNSIKQNSRNISSQLAYKNVISYNLQ